MSLRIVSHKRIQRKCRINEVVEIIAGRMYNVLSGTSGEHYLVIVHKDGATCSCKWGTRGNTKEKEQSGCNHVSAVFDQMNDDRSVSLWGPMEDARRQHRPINDIGDGVILTSRLRRNSKPKVSNILTEGIDDIL